MPCRKIGNKEVCVYPRTDWWRQSIGTDFINPGPAPEPDPDFFVSNSGTGTGDGSQGDPYTPAQLASALAGISNSIIAFNKGETFEIGEIDIVTNGITLTSYGTGSAPILIGSDDISTLTWADEGGGVYSTAMAQEPAWVFIDGACAKMAETDWIQITSKTTSSFTIDNADVSGFAGGIIGSYLIYKPYAFRLGLTHTVSNYTPGTGVINVTPSGVEGQDHYLKLLNKVDYFVGNNEWAWGSGTLYVKATANPSTLDIRANVYDYGLLIEDGADNCTIKNIEFVNYHSSAIKRKNAANTIIEGNTIHDLRGRGVLLTDHAATATVRNNTIYNACMGIGDYGTIQTNIYGNTIYDIGMQANYSWWISDPYLLVGIFNVVYNNGIGIAVINADDDVTEIVGGLIYENVVYNTAWCAHYLQGRLMKVYYNHMYNSDLRFSDAGIINTHGRTSPRYTVEDNEIYNNILHDAVGNVEGTTIDPADITARGIYVDNQNEGCYVHDNVVYNITSEAIHVNFDTKETRCENNIIVAGSAQLSYQENGSSVFTNVTNISNGNIMAVRDNTGYCYRTNYQAGYNPFATGGDSDNNYFINPYNTRVTDRNLTVDLTFAQTQTQFADDASSRGKVNWLPFINANQALLDVLLYTNYSASPVNQLIPDGYEDVDGNDVSNTTIEIPAYYGLLVLKTAADPAVGGLVSYYKLDEVSGNAIDAHSDNDGTVTGATYGATAKNVGLGTCYSFDGNDNVAINGVVADVAATTQGILACWANPIDATPAVAQSLITFGDTDGNSFIRILLDVDGFIFVQCRIAGTNQWTKKMSSSALSDGVWTHVALVHNGTEATIYVNGAAASQAFSVTTNLAAWFASATGIDNGRIGSQNFNSGGETGGFNGRIDEVAIYGSAADAGEVIATLYNSGNGSTYPFE